MEWNRRSASADRGRWSSAHTRTDEWSGVHAGFVGARDSSRPGGRLSPRIARSYWPLREMPADSGTQTVAGVLTQFGAQYLDQIAERANLSERDTLTGLWRLVAAGLVSNDSFAPLRLLTAEPDAARLIAQRQSHREPSRRDAALRARLQSSL